MTCTDVCQCQPYGNILAKINYDPSCNRKDANDAHFDDDCEDKTY